MEPAWRNKEGFLQTGVPSQDLRDEELAKGRRNKENPRKARTRRSMGLSYFSTSGEEWLKLLERQLAFVPAVCSRVFE